MRRQKTLIDLMEENPKLCKDLLDKIYPSDIKNIMLNAARYAYKALEKPGDIRTATPFDAFTASDLIVTALQAGYILGTRSAKK